MKLQIFHRQIKEYWIDLIFFIFVSMLIYLPKPFYSNQNQYFVHIVSNVNPSLKNDWLVNTKDTNQFFTWLFTPFFKFFGVNGIQYGTYIFFIISLIAIYQFIETFYESRQIARSVILSIGLLQSPVISYLFKDSSLQDIFTPFKGFGGQYLFLRSGYLQPAVGGVFLLFGIVCLFRDKKWFAFFLSLTSCSIHPSLIFSTLMLAILYFFVQYKKKMHSGSKCFTYYLFFAIILFCVTLLSNNNLILLFDTSASEKIALKRFAFERIPHHTLISNWPKDDLLMLFIWLVAISLVSRVPKEAHLKYILITTLTVSLITAIIVQITRNTALALLFPWRISGVLAPIIYGIVLGNFFKRFRKEKQIIWTGFLFSLVIPIALLSFHQSSVRDPYGDHLEITTRHQWGVGYVPIDQEYLRLQLQTPIFVDWKSPPYVGSDLKEWWRRIDLVLLIDNHPEKFCELNQSEEFSWIIWNRIFTVPNCLGVYNQKVLNDAFILFYRS